MESHQNPRFSFLNQMKKGRTKKKQYLKERNSIEKIDFCCPGFEILDDHQRNCTLKQQIRIKKVILLWIEINGKI